MLANSEKFDAIVWQSLEWHRFGKLGQSSERQLFLLSLGGGTSAKAPVTGGHIVCP